MHPGFKPQHGIIPALCLLVILPGFVLAQQATIANLPSDLLDDGASLFSEENAWWLLGGITSTLIAHEIEDPDGARRSLDGGFIDPIVDFGNTWASMEVQIPLALGFWGYGSWQDNEEIAGLGYDLSRGLFLSYGVTGVLKNIVQRTRPNGDPLSFPSGHTSAAFTTAGVLSQRYGGWIGGAGIGLGILTGLGRMEDEKHFASDVVAGATIGWIIGRTVGREKPQKETAWQMVPLGTGLAMLKRF
jgi:membrane-associated phospholipid phosphatase